MDIINLTDLKYIPCIYFDCVWLGDVFVNGTDIKLKRLMCNNNYYYCSCIPAQDIITIMMIL